MIEQALYTALSAWPALAPLVGSRIHHMQRPEGETGNAIIYQRISTVPVTSMAGESGLDAVRVQIACVSDVAMDAMQIAAAARACVKASSTLKGVPVMQINDLVEQTGQVRSIVDFNLWQRN